MTLTDIAVTTDPITGSTKAYGKALGCEGTKVPFRRVNLAGGEHLHDLHDTSVPYTDPGAVIDLTPGSAAQTVEPCASTLGPREGPDERSREELRPT